MPDRAAREVPGRSDLRTIAAGDERDPDHVGQSQGENPEHSAGVIRGDPAQACSGTERTVPVLKRKLWLLNFALIAAVAGGAWPLPHEPRALQARDLAALTQRPPAPPPPPASPV